MVGRSKYILLTSVAAVALCVTAGTAIAGPQGGVVVGGSATISQSGTKTDVHQSSSKAILDWRSFDVTAQEHVEFYQPSSSAIALNRINDTKASQIDGQLTANGHVMLINPNGIVFGVGSQVDVGSLTATTADIDNDDFMSERFNFNQAGEPNGAIVNHGSITVKEAGLVNLVAPRVENHGVILAKLGKVQLSAADTFTLDMVGDGLLQVAVTQEQARKLALNTGRITAEGGTIVLTASRARSIVDSLVENSGIIEAHSMTKAGGRVILGGAHTKVSGTINVNGKTGGGEVLIGGDYQGGVIENIETAQVTEITNTALITASATEQGDGGEVIVWADNATRYEGSIEAKGGPNGGVGGFVEVSGRHYLDFAGEVNLHGDQLGTLLLDPDDIDIVSGTSSPAEFSDGFIAFAENVGATSTIGADTLSGRLSANANVILQANNTIDVNANVDSTGAGNLTLETAVGGTITVNNAIDVNSGDLTLISDFIDINDDLNGRNITVQANDDIDINRSRLTSNGGNIILNSDRDENQSGGISFLDSTATTNGGDFIAGGGADPTTSLAYGSAGGFDMGVDISGSTINTASGDVVLNGHGEDNAANNVQFGVEVDGSSIITTSGDITINAHGGRSNNQGHGIRISSGLVTTNSGAININSVAGLVNIANDSALLISNNSVVEVTGSGDINLDLSGSVRAGDFSISNSGVNRLGSATMTGDIILLVDSFGVNGNDNFIITQGDIYIIPQTASTSIGLGGVPSDININDNELFQLFASGKIVIGDSVSGTGNVTIRSWDLSSNNSNIEIYGGEFDLDGLTLGGGDFLAHAQNGQDLLISDDITRTSDGSITLDLRADGSITNSNNANIVASDANSDGDSIATTDADSLNIILNADRDADQDGQISISNSTVTTNGGNIVIGGGATPLTGAAYGIGSSFVGVNLANSTFMTGLGDFTATGHGQNDAGGFGKTGLQLNSVRVETSSGDINITGTSGAGTGSGGAGERGVSIGDSGGVNPILLTDTGNITLNGTSKGTDNQSDGVVIGADIQSSTGNIVIKGTSNATATGSENEGVRISSADITSSGNITLTGSGGGGTDVNYGVVINGGNIETDGGDVIVNGTSNGSGQDNYGAYLLGGSNITSSGGSAGTITLEVDNIDIDGGVINSINDLIITQRTDGTSIGLGGGAGDLNLSDAELAQFNVGGDLIIGSTTAGDITVDSVDLSSIVGGDSIFATGGNFNNISGAGGLDTGVNRFLVFAAAPSNVTRNDLAGTDIFNTTFPSTISSSFGNSFVFASANPSLMANPVSLPSTVEFQIQKSSQSFNINTGYSILYRDDDFASNGNETHGSTSNFKVKRNNNQFETSSETYASVRLAEAKLLEIEQPVSDFYNLCSFNIKYCQ